MEKADFCLFAANGKWKTDVRFFGGQMINGTVIGDCCFSKRAHL
jgi:hypothetical protein